MLAYLNRRLPMLLLDRVRAPRVPSGGLRILGAMPFLATRTAFAVALIAALSLLPLRVAFAESRAPRTCTQHVPGFSAFPGLGCALQSTRTDALHSYDWRSAPGLGVAQRSKPPPPDELVNTARRFLGTPYSWGGIDEFGFDCSGFTNRVYALNGYDLPRTSREQFRVGVLVPLSELRAGDLLFFVEKPRSERITHVGMYVGDGEFIHASSGKGQVTFDRLDSTWYASRFIGARRITSLPPGRYSTSSGAARDGFALQSSTQVAEAAARVEVAKADANEPSVDADFLTEHAPGDRPPQLATSLDKGALTRLGPDLLLAPSTALGVRLGVGSMDGGWSLLAVPEFSYFGHDNAFRFAVAAPFEWQLTPGSSAARSQWDSVRGWLRILREVSFGEKESSFYVDLGRTTSGSLGHGQLMRYFTPNVASRFLPRHGLGADALTLSFDGSLDWGGFEILVDDVTRPGVVGATLWSRPAAMAGSASRFWRNVSLGVTYAGDWNAPYRWNAPADASPDASPEQVVPELERATVHSAGASLELKLVDGQRFDMKTYVDTSTLLFGNDFGVGGALGTLMRANLGGRKSHSLRLRLEGRLSGPGFIPSYFDATYALDNVAASSLAAAPATRLQRLEKLSDGPSRWSVYGEASWRFARIAEAGVSYEGGRELGALPDEPDFPLLGHNVMAFLGIRELYMPESRRPVRLRVSWHLRNLHYGDAPNERPEQYLFATASYSVFRWLSVAGAVRYALSASSGTGTVDGVVEIASGWEF